MKNNRDGYPSPTKNIWILIDVSNSNARSKNYLWWFETRKLARDFKEWHESTYKAGASLVGPLHYKAVKR